MQLNPNNLVANNQMKKINTDFINSINNLKKNKEINQPITDIRRNPISQPFRSEVQSAPTPTIPKQPFLNVNWSNIFLTICKKRLFNYFKDLKLIIHKNPNFNSKFLCYIDETNMKYLIQNSKYSHSTTLRIKLNRILENQINNPNETNLRNSMDINKALDLVKNLETMGPSNNLLIDLDQDQIKLLQNMYQDGKELYWPNGKDGITWLVHFN
jgi:hypothetical protein